jgi:hypothetical protein
MIASPSNPIALAVDIRALGAQLVELADALVKALQPVPASSPRASTKGTGYHMSEPAIDALYADFAADELSISELAEKHRISKSGVTKRKGMWRMGRR